MLGKTVSHVRPSVLIALGLFGLSGYTFAVQFPHSAILEQDFAKGIWVGVCIGLEVIGLVHLRNGKRNWAV